MAGEFSDVGFQPSDHVEDMTQGAAELARQERKLTRAALGRAEDVLVDPNAPTLWEQRRNEALAEGGQSQSDAGKYDYLDQLRLSDPSQQPSRSRKIGRSARRGF